jgi:predicted transposase/invertase (TIGR01784 family)
MFDEDERMIYEVRMQSLADMESKIASAIEKGMEEGLERGKAEGMYEAKKQIALSLYQSGMIPEVIAKATGLSELEIQQIVQQEN